MKYEELRVLMVRKGYTISKLAESAGISRQWISRVFNQDHGFGNEAKSRVAEVLGIREEEYPKYFS